MQPFDRLSLFTALVACAIAAVSAQPFARSWNDGSRLATVESLVDYHTWAIDGSIFARPIPADAKSPFVREINSPLQGGTKDKMWIDGHFYSDKSPVPSLAMAAIYRGLQAVTGLVARDEPNRFCYWITLLSSGLAYVISICCIDGLAVLHGLQRSRRILVTISFALATVALAYSRNVNGHILSLAACSALLIQISRMSGVATGRLITVGILLGMNYAIDVVIGAVLVVCTLVLIAMQTRRWTSCLIVLTAAFPWFVLHHAINFRIGGTLLPANANAAYFQWPGSPFQAATLTGGWHHDSILKFVGYALDLLVGHRGFILTNVPLWPAIAGAIWLIRRRVPETRCVWFAASVAGLTWVIYAIASNNHSGDCLSVRWFVPLLAPAYYILVILLRHDRRAGLELFTLTAGGMLIALLAWRQGPWNPRMVPGFWFILGATGTAWLVLSRRNVGRRLSEIVNKESGRAIDRTVIAN